MKVISFSVWGNEAHFLNGALTNIHLAKLYYPNWKVRMYCSEDVGGCSRKMMEEAGADVRLVKYKVGGWEGLFWRFYPIWDHEVTHTISRDCDSRLNPREAAAVEQWMASDQLFHTMRDHHEHIVPILGGMFGCRHWPEMRGLLMQWEQLKAKGDDQVWLEKRIWPLVKPRCMAHDRYPTATKIPDTSFVYDPTKFFGAHDIRAFPAHEPLDPKIHGAFVGSRVLNTSENSHPST